jgi:cytochrome c553
MRLLLLAIVLAVSSGGCGKNDKPPPPTSGSPRATPESGPGMRSGGGGGGGPSADEQAAAMFRDTCSLCHGINGMGDGQMAGSLTPKPRNYTDAAWQASVTDDDIKKIILEGGQAVGKSPNMPAQKAQLGNKPEVVDALVRIIRGFGPKK